MTIAVVVADDQPMVRAGLRVVPEAEPDIGVVGPADGDTDAIYPGESTVR